MTTIRAVCPDCRDVVVTEHDVEVHLCRELSFQAYVFRCPMCHLQTSVNCSNRVVQLLATTGCHLREFTPPTGLGSRPSGPPLTHDDLLDFHEQLNDELDQLLLPPEPAP